MTPERYREVRADLDDYVLDLAKHLGIDRKTAFDLALVVLAEMSDGAHHGGARHQGFVQLGDAALKIVMRIKIEGYLEEEVRVRRDEKDLNLKQVAQLRAESLRDLMFVLVGIIVDTSEFAT